MEEAIVAVIIQAFLDVVGFICALFVLPAKFCVSAARWFEQKTRQLYTEHADLWALEALLWVPRCLVLDVAVVLYCAAIFSASAMLFITRSVFAGVVSSLVVLTIFLYGSAYAKANPWLRLWFPRGPLFGEDGVIPLFITVHAGLHSFVCLVWCAITVVRIPSLISYYNMRNELAKTCNNSNSNSNNSSDNDSDEGNDSSSSQVNDLSTQARSEAFIAILDLLRYIFYIITPFWRLSEQVSQHRQLWSDVPVSAKPSWTPEHKHYVIRDTFTALRHLLAGVAEVPIFALLLVLLLFAPWRIAASIQAATSPPDERRRAALRELTYAVADLASIAVGAALCLTWRGPQLAWRLWCLGHSAPAVARRKAVWGLVPMLLRDVMDVPCLLMGLFVVVTLWRLAPLCSELSKCSSRGQARKVVQTQFFRCLVDVPAGVLFIVVCVTGWRAPNLIHRIQQISQQQCSSESNGDSDSEDDNDDDNDESHNRDSDDDEAPPPPPPTHPAKRFKMLSEWHKVVFSEATQLLIDTPFPILAVLTLWRLPLLLYRMVTRCKTAGERRQLVLHQIWQVAKDVPCIVMAAAICIIGWWRIPTLFRELRAYEPGDDAHRIVLYIFFAFLGDLPYAAAMLAAATLACWRVPAMLRDVQSRCRNASDVRGLALGYLGVAVADYCCVVTLMFTLLAVVRIPTYVYYVRHFYAIYSQERADEAAAARCKSKSKDDASTTNRATGGGAYNGPTCSARDGVLTKTLYMTSWLVFGLFLLDTWLAVMIVFIFLGVFHVPDLVKSYVKLLRLFHRGGRAQDEDPQTIWHYNYGMKQRSYYHEGPDAPFSLTIFEPAISDHFFSTLRDIPHLVFLPLKLVAPLFYPAYLWIGYRSAAVSAALKAHVTTNDNNSDPNSVTPPPPPPATSPAPSISPSLSSKLSPSGGSNESINNESITSTVLRVTHSFIFEWAASQRAKASASTNVWGAHIFTLRMCAATVLTLANDIAALLLVCNTAFLFVATLGSPLWKERAGHTSPRTQRALRICVFIATIITVPAMALADGALILTPLYRMYHTTNNHSNDSNTNNNNTYSNCIGEHTPKLWFWELWLWHVRVLSVLCFSGTVGAALVHMTSRVSEARVFEWFSPAAAFSWGYDEILVGSVLRGYARLLERGTAWCYPYRSVRHLFLGELLLAVLVGVWALWPLLVALALWDPRVRGQRLPPAVAAQIAIFMLDYSRRVVSLQWAKLVAGHRRRSPGLALTSLVPLFVAGEQHGFAVEVRGVKPIGLAVRQARMRLCGEQFWTALAAAMGPLRISVLRNMYHPITLCPAFLDPAPLSEGVERVAVRFTFGTPAQPARLLVSRRRLVGYLEAVVADGDPVVEVVVDYGTKFWGIWSIQGRLITLRLRISAFLEALTTDAPVNLLESGGAWVVSTTIASAVTSSSNNIKEKAA